MGWWKALARGLDRLRARLYPWRFVAAHALGRRAEGLAPRHLEKLGYVILDRNWFNAAALSEIDLVARDGDELVFVEVKARAAEGLAGPARAVNAVKRAALLRGAGIYALKAGVPRLRTRVDIVSIVLAEPPRVTVLRGQTLRPRGGRNAVC